MTITNGYATLAEFKDNVRLHISSTDTTDDSILETIIEATSRLIDNECARWFFPTSTGSTDTRYYTPYSETEVHPDDLISVTTLTVDNGDRTYAYTLTEGTDFDLWPYNSSSDGRPYSRIDIIPTSKYRFYIGIPKGVKITGRFGWSAVPKPIHDACLLQAERLYKRYKAPLGVSAMSALGEVALKMPSLDPDVMMMILPYRRPVIG